MTQPQPPQQPQQQLQQQQQPQQQQQQPQPQQQPQQQQQQQQQQQLQLQQQPQQMQRVMVQPQLLTDTKSVTFNDIVDEKIISAEDNNKTNINTSNLETEIKKIKLGKLLVPQTTLIFTIILIVIGTGLFFATKQKKNK